jgi:hypothetical protein
LQLVESQTVSAFVVPEYKVLSTGFDYVDSELEGLRPGNIHLVKGRSNLIDLFIYRAMVRNIIGLNRPVVFVDCGNSFSPYKIASICRASGFDAKEVLQKILISRPFTAYQLNTLIEESLSDTLTTTGPMLLVFSRPLNLFSSDDVDEKDASIILRRMLKDLKGLTTGEYPLLISHDMRKMRGVSGTAQVADTVYNIKDLGEQKLSIFVEKDPSMSPRFLELIFSNNVQSILDDYLEMF